MNLTLCREDGLYRAGGMLSVKWRVSRVPLDEIQGIEISVLWHTEGKGDEDLHVHHFHRVVESRVRRVGLADEQSVNCVLPATPLSYHGQLLSLQWCVRMRLFLAGGREIVAEQPFHLISADSNASLAMEATKSVVSLHGGNQAGTKTRGGNPRSPLIATDLSDHSSAS